MFCCYFFLLTRTWHFSTKFLRVHCKREIYECLFSDEFHFNRNKKQKQETKNTARNKDKRAELLYYNRLFMSKSKIKLEAMLFHRRVLILTRNEHEINNKV